MCPPVRIFLASALLLAVGANVAGAQNAPPSLNTPSSGTLQKPSGPPRDQPMKPPVAAPRQAVHKDGGTAQTPVVPPHGPVHAKKPATAAVVHKPVLVPSVPPPVAPVPLPAETTAAPDKLPDPEKPDGVPAKLPRFASLRSA